MGSHRGPDLGVLAPDDGTGRGVIEDVAEANVERGADPGQRGERDRGQIALQLAEEAAGQPGCLGQGRHGHAPFVAKAAKALADRGLGGQLRGQGPSLAPWLTAVAPHFSVTKARHHRRPARARVPRLRCARARARACPPASGGRARRRRAGHAHASVRDRPRPGTTPTGGWRSRARSSSPTGSQTLYCFDQDRRALQPHRVLARRRHEPLLPVDTWLTRSTFPSRMTSSTCRSRRISTHAPGPSFAAWAASPCRAPSASPVRRCRPGGAAPTSGRRSRPSRSAGRTCRQCRSRRGSRARRASAAAPSRPGGCRPACSARLDATVASARDGAVLADAGGATASAISVIAVAAVAARTSVENGARLPTAGEL